MTTIDLAVTTWRSYAACRGQNPLPWETPTKRSAVPDEVAIGQARYALSVCRTCPVRRECGEDVEGTRVIGMIRAGVPYDDNGAAAPVCIVCGARVLLGDPRCRYCEKHDKYDLTRLGRKATA